MFEYQRFCKTYDYFKDELFENVPNFRESEESPTVEFDDEQQAGIHCQNAFLNQRFKLLFQCFFVRF